ncbi:hypothetical protein BH10BAC5_BH10BAC5_05090 [soil metagenome]
MVKRIGFNPGAAPDFASSIILKLKNRLMKNLFWLLILTIFPMFFTGCSAIGDIFKAGIWVGIIVVVAIIAIIGFLMKMFKK